tara:strand:+ start:1287 stop:2471 length:1185 start_codon:yes stop_codon:yes gene_type:complete
MKSILTPEFYSFIMSNKQAYGATVLDQVNDAAESITLNRKQKESLAVVLSGRITGLPDGKSAMFPNDIKTVIFSLDRIPRKKVKFRSIDNQIYSSEFLDYTSMLKSPFEPGISEDELFYRINGHPEAYTVTAGFESSLSFGSLVIVRQAGEDFFIISHVASPDAKVLLGTGDSTGSKKRFDDEALGGTSALHPLEKKYGLRRQRRRYSGQLTDYHDIVLYNGSLPSGMLQVPDTTYWQRMGSGNGSILVDYIESFNAMAKAFHDHFGVKMRSSGIRSFEQQIINRNNSIKTSESCESLTDPKGCGTAIPGRSNHGWGQAVDIRTPKGAKCYGAACFIQRNDKYHKWLLKNAYKIGFAGRKWGHLGQVDENGKYVLPKQRYEAWHWEPISDRVLK